MTWGRLSTLVVALCLVSASSLAWQKGIALGLYSKDPRYSYLKELEEIQKTGADHVSMVVSWYQKDIHSNKIYPRDLTGKEGENFDYVTIPQQQLSQAVDTAHRLGLKVFLFPILRIEQRSQKEWRGELHPMDPEQWWRSYENFILTYARFAAEHHIEIFSVGSELCSMESDNAQWRELIKAVRDHYDGKLLYSANWDHYRKIGFWRDLDFLGVNGYYQLASHPHPTLAELIGRWYEIRERLLEWQEQYNRPLVLTELGYPSVEGTSQAPWDYSRSAQVNLEEQALCYESFFRVWGNNKHLDGVYFWNWYGDGGPGDTSYTPRHKPAGEVLTQWFQNFLPSQSSASSSVPARPHS